MPSLDQALTCVTVK